jgi:hypothetical protein
MDGYIERYKSTNAENAILVVNGQQSPTIRSELSGLPTGSVKSKPKNDILEMARAMLDGEVPLVLYRATSEEDECVDDEQVDERQ